MIEILNISVKTVPKNGEINLVVEDLTKYNLNIVGVNVCSSIDDVAPVIAAYIPQKINFNKNRLLIIYTSTQAITKKVKLIQKIVSSIKIPALPDHKEIQYIVGLKRFFVNEYIFKNHRKTAEALNTNRQMARYYIKGIEYDIEFKTQPYFDTIKKVIIELEKNGIHTPKELQAKIYPATKKDMDEKKNDQLRLWKPKMEERKFQFQSLESSLRKM